MKLPKEKTGLYILIAIAVIVKVILLHGISNFRVWEENEMAINYMNTGQMTYVHDGVVTHNFAFPVYPFILFLIYKIVGINYTYAAFLNIILSAFSALFMYDVFNVFFSRFNLPFKFREWRVKILYIAIAAYLFHPLIMYYEIKNVHPFALYLFLYVLALWMMVKYFEKTTWLNLTIYALLMGLVILERATLVAVFVPFFLWLWKKNGFKEWLLKTTYVLVISSLFSILWMWNIHNKSNSAYLMPNIGMGLWVGSLPQTEGSNNFSNGNTFYSALSDSDLTAISKTSITKQDSFYRAKYLYTLKHNRGQIAQMFLVKFKNFWLFREAIGVDYPVWIQRLIPIYKVIYIVILILALGAALIIKKQAWILLSVPFVVSLIHAAVYVETRHRIMFEPILIFLAIIGVALLLNRFQKREVTN